MNRTVRHSTPRLLAIAATLVVALIVVVLLLSDGRSGYTVKAEFKDSAGLRKDSDVKIGGVPAGRITKIDLTSRDTAMVTMKLDGGGVPIGTGASAEARPVNLLGEKYVDLDPGDLKRPVGSGTTIAMSRTSAPVELDQVIDTLDPTTRGKLRILINEAGIGLRGRGADFNELLDRMPPSLNEGRQLMADFAADTAQLKHLASTGDQVLGSFAAGRDKLADLVNTAHEVLQVTADERAQLGQTIDRAPSTLRQLQATLGTLDTASRRLKPAAVQIQRTAPALTDTLTRLPDLQDDAHPTLAKVEAVSPDLSRLGRKGSPVVARLKLPAQELQRFSTVFDPLSRTLDTQTNPLLRVLEGWTRTIQTRDNAGHVFRTEAVVDKHLLTLLASKIDNGGKKEARPQDTGPSAGADGAQLKTKPTVRSPGPSTPPETTTTAPTTSAAPPSTPAKPEGLIPGLLNGLKGLVGGR